MNNEKLNKFQTLISKDVSPLHQKMAWRRANATWLAKSAAIAIKVLSTIKAKKMSQLQLAELMNVTPQQVNKIIKGEENLSLETIVKLELALGTQLIAIPEYQFTNPFVLQSDTPFQTWNPIQHVISVRNQLIHERNLSLQASKTLTSQISIMPNVNNELFYPLGSEFIQSLINQLPKGNTQYSMCA